MKNKKLLELILSLVDSDDTESQKIDPDKGRGELRIAVLQRGWIYVGNYYREGNDCRLENASCIRNWGTTNGLGEIAENGPTSRTKLDPCPTVEFHRLGEVLTIICNSKKWK